MANKSWIRVLVIGLALCGCDRPSCDVRHPDPLAEAQRQLEAADASVAGRLGACVGWAGRIACTRGGERFQMQSVMKLLIAVAVFREADLGHLRLDDPVTVTRRDVSVGIQPLAALVEARPALTLDARELTRRMLTESDSMATDVLIGRLGGTRAVQATLQKLGVAGLRIDRTERQLQTEPFGLPESFEWHGMADYEQRIARRSRGAVARSDDVRDTATPQALATMLQGIAEGRLLSAASARELISMLSGTQTFPDRLRAGAPPGWTVAHKTGTSRTFGGVVAATNDVGYLIAPDGTRIVAVALLADSPAPAGKRAAALASVARIAAASYGRHPEAARLACNVP